MALYDCALMSTETSTETYAQWLDRQMQARGFTQRSLAKAWNPAKPEIGRTSIRRFLTGETVPRLSTRESLARALGSRESGPKPSDDKEGD